MSCRAILKCTVLMFSVLGLNLYIIDIGNPADPREFHCLKGLSVIFSS